MTTMNSNTKAGLLQIGELLLVLIFGLSFPQWPLYSSHQNTYPLHGLAHAGVGFLNLDWLAHTTDPYPAFSALVTLTIQTLGERAFYFFFIVLLAIYGYSIWGIVRELFGLDGAIEKYLIYFVLLTVLVIGVLRGRKHGLSLELLSGKLCWRAPDNFGGFKKGSLIRVNDELVVLGEEGHLARVYTKLQIAGRAEVSAALDGKDQGVDPVAERTASRDTRR